jgi:hypothetical protein
VDGNSNHLRHDRGREYVQMKKRPRDPNQLGKHIIGIATGEMEDREPHPSDFENDPGDGPRRDG